MVRNTKKESESRTSPSSSPQRAIELIRLQQEKGKKLLHGRPLTENDKRNWAHLTHEILIKSFGSPSEHVQKFDMAGRRSIYRMDQDEKYYEDLRIKEITSQISFLDTCIEVLNLEIEETPNTANNTEKVLSISSESKDIFLVHGHDDGIKESVARFITRLGLNPIILHERPDKGRTIIEKFEQEHQTAAFAIILMTSDDMGASKENVSNLKPRARQNVIFELGFFLGKLGRSRVCVLFDASIEKPSDYEGCYFFLLMVVCGNLS